MSQNSQGTEEVLSFGQKAVGATFNPSKKEEVNEIKKLTARLIDLLNNNREMGVTAGAKRYYSKAISHYEDAQMNAVKAATWEYE
jgi:hypothetical protein